MKYQNMLEIENLKAKNKRLIWLILLLVILYFVGGFSFIFSKNYSIIESTIVQKENFRYIGKVSCDQKKLTLFIYRRVKDNQIIFKEQLIKKYVIPFIRRLL
jgi:flagellar basal body-associated protein FliL